MAKRTVWLTLRVNLLVDFILLVGRLQLFSRKKKSESRFALRQNRPSDYPAGCQQQVKGVNLTADEGGEPSQGGYRPTCVVRFQGI